MKKSIGDMVITPRQLLEEKTILAFCNYYYEICIACDKDEMPYDEKMKYILCNIESKYNVKMNITNINQLKNKNIIESAYEIYKVFLENYHINEEAILQKVKQVILKKSYLIGVPLEAAL